MSIQKRERPRPEDPGQLAAENSEGKVTKDNLQIEDELVNEIMEMPFQELMTTMGVDAEKLESRIRMVAKRKLAEKRGL